jgi:predicted transcriptional regulator
MTPVPLSDAEWKIMNAVWARGGPVSGRDVHAALVEQTGWAYTTVKTMLDRLVEKGALAATKERNVSQYRSRLPRQRAVTAAVRSLTDRAFGGAVIPLVHHLVGSRKLSARDRAELRRMLDTADASDPEGDEP